jgi:ubiquinone/menaquinone biosynthesis C-methylase UbiE
MLIFVVTIGAIAILAGQCKKPKWIIGRLYLWLMSRTHSSLIGWGIERLPIRPTDTILDVGCGSGRGINSLAARARGGKVYGIDHSSDSVATARQTNAALIRSGSVDIRLGSVSNLPFAPDSFDLVTAVETHYYWPNPPNDFREIMRVVKPGGTFVIIAETHRRNGDAIQPLVMRMLGGKCPSAEELCDQLALAGFSTIQVLDNPKKGWLSVAAQRATRSIPPCCVRT